MYVLYFIPCHELITQNLKKNKLNNAFHGGKSLLLTGIFRECFLGEEASPISLKGGDNGPERPGQGDCTSKT